LSGFNLISTDLARTTLPLASFGLVTPRLTEQTTRDPGAVFVFVEEAGWTGLASFPALLIFTF
jgi:hypothetical protein